MQCEGPAAYPKNYEIECRLILDVLQCHSLNFTLYELSPFSSGFPPFSLTMLLCNDLCRARDFTFSHVFTCSEYIAPFRNRKTNMFRNSSSKVLFALYYQLVCLLTQLAYQYIIPIFFFEKCGFL